MDLFNVKTRKKENIEDPEALNDSLKSGSHSYQTGQEIEALNPYGERVLLDTSKTDIQALASQGYKFKTNNEQEVQKFVDDHSGPLSSIGVGAAQFVNQMGLGIPELVANKYLSPLEIAKKEALKKEHQAGNVIGGVAGFLGSPFALPGKALFKGASKAGQATEKYIADKLAVEAGANVGRGKINQAAREIASKIMGGAAEGAAIASPHVITEAMLGDTQVAGEHLLAGVGIGAVFGGGVGLGKELLGIGKKIDNQAFQHEMKKDSEIKKIFRKIQRVVTGIDEADLKYYIENNEKVNSAMPRSDLMHYIDETVGEYRNILEQAKEKFQNSEKYLDESYRNRRRDLSQARPAESLAGEMSSSLESVKHELGNLSNQSDEILGSIPGGVSLARIVDLVRQVKREYVPITISSKAQAVESKLNNLESNISNLGGPIVPFPTVREIVRQVREDIDWSPLASEFNTRLNNANKSFSERLSDIVKGNSPEYVEKMAQMSNLAQLHEKMQKLGFTDPTKGRAAFEKIIKSDSAASRGLLAEYDAATGSRFTDELNNQLRIKGMLEKTYRSDKRHALVPDAYRAFTGAKDAYEKELIKFKPISTLTTERIQPAMANMRRKEENILTKEAFEKLEELSGVPFLEMIRDRNILDAFNKHNINGSKITNASTFVAGGIGSAIGLGSLGPLGVILGAMGGATADVYGGQGLKWLLDKNPANMTGLLFVEKALKKNADEIDRIPGIIENFSKKIQEVSKPSTLAITALYRVLKENKEDDRTSYNASLSDSANKIGEISDRVSQLLNDPMHLQEHIARLTDGLMNGGSPEIASMFAMEVQKSLRYISKEIPKPPRPSSPFAPKVNWTPPDYQIFDFAQKLEVLENPLMVIDALENGTLSKNHMGSLKENFPALHDEIKTKIIETAMSGATVELDYSKRLQLSLLLGEPLDKSLERKSIQYYQSTFTELEQQEAQAQGKSSFKVTTQDQLTQAQGLLSPRGVKSYV